MSKQAGQYERVKQCIQDNQPITSRELYEYLPEYTDAQIRACVSSLRKINKVIYISGWIREGAAQNFRATAQYSMGQGVEPKKPPRLKRQVYRQRYLAKKKSFVSSVFELGVCLDDRRITTRKRPDVAERRQKQPVAHPG
jgi:hypothetical protein